MAKVERNIKRVALGDGLYRNTVTVSGFPCSAEGAAHRQQLTRMLQQLYEEPHLLTQGIGFPDRILIKHDGSGWVAVIDSEEESLPFA